MTSANEKVFITAIHSIHSITYDLLPYKAKSIDSQQWEPYSWPHVISTRTFQCIVHGNHVPATGTTIAKTADNHIHAGEARQIPLSTL